MLKLNPQFARQADSISNQIREAGKYIGVITRAEHIQSSKGTPGIGLSFKSDNGETCDYLDQYIGETDGKPWTSTNTVNALLCCLKIKEANIGKVKFEAWNSETKQREMVEAQGYPDIQGQRIGFLLQKEISEYEGKEREKMVIYGVFQADTELTASEILDKKITPEKLPKMLQALMSKPVIDKRQKTTSHQPQKTNSFDHFNDDIPF